MPYNGILVRDSLSDTGVVPSPGYPYYSPDMIAYQQVSDPVTFFTNNYGQDPNQILETGQWNFIYARGKNLSTAQMGGYMFIYYSQTSLVMNTNLWGNNGLTTAGGLQYVTLPVVAPNAITVASQPFAWRPPGDNNSYCIVGMVSQTTTNQVPAPFSDWNSFVVWVRNNQNICWRNLTIRNNATDPQWDTLSLFSNLESQNVPVMFTATASNNVPIGTTLSLRCSALNINASQVITNTPQSRILTASSMCPANFIGSIETMAFIPQGATWPSGATVTTIAYIGVDGRDILGKFAKPWEHFGTTPLELGMNENGVLVEVGNTAITLNTPSVD